MNFTDKFNAKYSNPIKRQNLPIIEQKKPVLLECYSCKHFERGEKIGLVPCLNWCKTKEFDRVKKRSVIHYANIDLLKTCPKTIGKKQYR